MRIMLSVFTLLVLEVRRASELAVTVIIYCMYSIPFLTVFVSILCSIVISWSEASEFYVGLVTTAEWAGEFLGELLKF